MAERLTDKNTISVYNNSNSEIYLGKGEEATKYIYKLAQLEDIMEKYHCNDIGELEKKLADGITWKRACELACETLKQVMGKPLWIGGNIPTPEVKDSDYFYQQAKKEGESK